MGIFTALEVASSGLAAQRVRMNVAASNVANVHTTDTPEGGPYRRKDVVLSSTQTSMENIGGTNGAYKQAVQSVEVTGIVEDTAVPQFEYDPGHPQADEDGYVAYPNINVVEEMVDMITASRAYEAGITAMRSTTQMADRALRIGG